MGAVSAAGGDRGGLITYLRRLADTRGIGWQFQEGQLRFYVTIEDPSLQGPAQRAARETIVEAEYADFFDHTDVAAHPRARLEGKELRSRRVARFQPGLRLPAPSSEARRLNGSALASAGLNDKSG